MIEDIINPKSYALNHVAARFICKEHEDYGSDGWQLEGHPDFDPLGGIAVAHDLMEHPTEAQAARYGISPDRPEGETMAFGAIIWGRGEGGYFRYNTVAYNISGEMVYTILQHAIEEDMGLRPPPHTEPLDSDYSYSAAWAEDQIDEAMKLAKKHIYTELRYREESRDTRRSYYRNLPNMRGWLRLGWLAAQERYEGIIEPYAFQELFKSVEEAADSALKFANSDDGHMLDVDINLAEAQYTVTLLRPFSFDEEVEEEELVRRWSNVPGKTVGEE